MGTLYLTEPYCFVRKESERLKVYKNSELLREVRVNDYQRVYVHDSTTLTTDALQLLAEHQIYVVYFSGNSVVGRFIGTENKNVSLRIAQVKAHLDEDASFKIAKPMILAKCINSRISLQRYARKRPHEKLDETVAFLRTLCQKIVQAHSLDELRGFEGIAAKQYFSVFPLLIKDDSFSFTGRQRRPARDEANVLLNYGYALLRAEVSAALYAAGLDPYIGFLHRERYGRESLTFDLMEEFRAILVDNFVLRLLNQPILTKKDFMEEHGSLRLSNQARKVVLREWEGWRKREVIHQLLQKKMTYREVFQTQALVLAKVIKGEIEEYLPYLTR